jgi:hypothetical protein
MRTLATLPIPDGEGRVATGRKSIAATKRLREMFGAPHPRFLVPP